MFSDPKIQAVFEEYALRERNEASAMGTVGFADRDNYLLAVGEDAARFLHSLILAKKPKRILEVGTSYGYSTLFLADAAQNIGSKVVTLELDQSKQDHAKEKMKTAGLEDSIEFHLGDAVSYIKSANETFDFVFLDIWKELYTPVFEALYPKLSDEGIIAADNMYFPEGVLEQTRTYRRAVQSHKDLQTTLLPIGSGIELTCRWPKNSAKL